MSDHTTPTTPITTRPIEVEVEDYRDHATDTTRFIWSLRATGPVRYLFRSSGSYPSRAAALDNFQDVCRLLGWENLATEVTVR